MAVVTTSEPILTQPSPRTTHFDSIGSAIVDLQQGKPVIVVDDEDRENEGDLVIAAQFATASQVNFMATHARGLICMPMLGSDLDRLEIPMMTTRRNGQPHASPFTVSVEAARGVTTGISADDRAETIRTLLDPNSTPNDIAIPGHMFPLRAHEKGIRGRRGHTEASIDLMRCANLYPAAVICEIMNTNGSMARRADLALFAASNNLRIVTISDLEAYLDSSNTRNIDHSQPAAVERSLSKFSSAYGNVPAHNADANNHADAVVRDSASRVTKLSDEAALPTRHGHFRVTAFGDENGGEHLAVVYGNPFHESAPVVRIHSECLTGDALGSVRCDCADQLHLAMKTIVDEGSGVLLYLRQEGRGIGLANKIKAYALQDTGLDTVEANRCLGFEPDERDYHAAVGMLDRLAIRELRLLTNNPAKLDALERAGISIRERLPLSISRRENENYLRTKARKMNHLL